MPLTRQQIANLTGLRVETVIWTIKKMAQEKILKLDGRTIFY
ncbi:helix-turn-helix domain-containing protein [Chryseobacterium sp. AG844]|nr:helix-turn-helix domain-containing protein [Chryseobacterium sp. AG844]